MGGESGSRPSTHSYPKLAVRPVGKQIHNIYRDRLRQFIDHGQYEGQSLLPYVYVSFGFTLAVLIVRQKNH